jgi:hypothetical protein
VIQDNTERLRQLAPARGWVSANLWSNRATRGGTIKGIINYKNNPGDFIVCANNFVEFPDSLRAKLP